MIRERIPSLSSRALLMAGAGATVATAYVATAARSVTRWDSGEFLAAVHSLGIPHPPGAPVYVLLARVWSMLPLPFNFAFRVNLFSAACAVAAVTLTGVLVRRWTGDAVAGAAAVLCTGGTCTLWLSATEAEVYAPALLVAVLLLLIADARHVPIPRRYVLLAFAAGLGWALHPASLLTLPAAAFLLLRPPQQGGGGGERVQSPLTAGAAARGAMAAALGLSAVLFLLVRAQHDPVINQGNPSDPHSLWAVLTRAQYADAGLWPRQAPLWLQAGNWFEYADWQFAYGLSPGPPPSWRRTPITLLFAMLGVTGAVAHRRWDRRSWWALVVAMITTTVGLILYLNLKVGPSYGHGILADTAPREARERDYFFITSFVIWGAWAGIGAAVAARRLLNTERRGRSAAGAAVAALLLAATPLILNFGWVREQRAVGSAAVRRTAVELLSAVPPGGVLLAAGDNDTYPLWYAQVIEGVRRDVTVVTVPLMAAEWYRRELQRRNELLYDGQNGTSDGVAAVCRAAADRGRQVVLTPYADADTLTSVCPGLQPVRVQPSD